MRHSPLNRDVLVTLFLLPEQALFCLSLEGPGDQVTRYLNLAGGVVILEIPKCRVIILFLEVVDSRSEKEE